MKYQLHRGMKNLDYLTDHILYHIFKIIFQYAIKKRDTLPNKPATKNIPKQNRNRITFKIETGYYIKLLTPETMKLLSSTNS